MPTNPNESIIINDNGVNVELTGQDLENFETMLAATNAANDAEKAEQEAKAAARESALAKLADLGLTEEEVAAL
jgi:ABC-type polar amino acid transport system ATPase subunit